MRQAGDQGDLTTAPLSPPHEEVDPPPDGLVGLFLALETQVDPGRVPAVLGAATAPWLGEAAPTITPGIRRYYGDLELRVSDTQRSWFRKSAIVGLGEPRRDGAAWLVPIEWRAATLAPLFPVFAGHLRVAGGRLELSGSYAPPGGVVGQVLDAALMRLAARGTGRWFLTRIATALTEDA
jgi:hypothetical protein